MRPALLSVLLLVLLGSSCDPGSAFGSTTGWCEAGDAPRLPRAEHDGLAVGTFEARARSNDLAGQATSRTSTSYWNGERDVDIGVLQLLDDRYGLTIRAPELLDPQPRTTIDVSISYTDGGGTAFGGAGEFRVESVSEAGVLGVFSACTDRYPMGALFVEKALVRGGVHAEIPGD
jgi:hypothetical protein